MKARLGIQLVSNFVLASGLSFTALPDYAVAVPIGAGCGDVIKNCAFGGQPISAYTNPITGYTEISMGCWDEHHTVLLGKGLCGYGSLSGPIFTPTTAQRTNLPTLACGSIIEVENRTLGESIEVTGTPYSLYYFSDRSTGRLDQNKIIVPIMGPVLDPNLQKAIVQIEIAGRTIRTEHAPAANLNYTYTWDGKDSSGRVFRGTAQAKVTFSMVWKDGTGDFPMTSTLLVGGYRPKLLGLGGWTLSSNHFYDFNSKTVFFGSGSSRGGAAKDLGSGFFRIASQDASEAYEFNSSGLHIRTRHGLTGAILLTFTYDSAGRLLTATDAFGNRTTITRDAAGNPLSITSPYGQVTTLSVNSAGMLASTTNPNSEMRLMTYSSNGLLLNFKKAKNNSGTISTSLSSTFTYDVDGRLVTDTNNGLPAGSYVARLLDIANSENQRTLQMSTAENRVTKYTLTNIDTTQPDAFRRQTTLPNGLEVMTEDYSQGSTVQYHDVKNQTSRSIDARFPEATFTSGAQVTIGSYYHYSSRSQSVTLTDQMNPFSITTMTMQNVTNGDSTNRLSTLTYDGPSRKYTARSPANRGLEIVTNAQGMPVRYQEGSFYPYTFAYDTRGRLSSLTQNSRVTRFVYDTLGRVSSVSNVLNQTTSYAYDNAGQVLQKTLPDGRQINFTYDSHGNLKSLTPPGRPVHNFAVSILDLTTAYNAPVVASGQNAQTTYGYNKDKQLLRVTRPNGASINMSYTATTGQLAAIATPQGTINLGWDMSSGRLQSVRSSDAIESTSVYNGPVETEQVTINSASSSEIGRITIGLNADLLKANEAITTPSTASSNVNYAYDKDGLLMSVGAISFGRSSVSGRLSSAKMGVVNESYGYNQYGELTSSKVTVGTNTRYSASILRDELGRVSIKTDSLEGSGASFAYYYDSAGRLNKVTRNNVVVSTHTYDSNSNRTSGTTNGVAYSATYDSQDRLTSYAGKTYTYNLNGELASVKTTATGATTAVAFDTFGNLRTFGAVKYQYDGYGRRVAKLYNGVLQERYLYRNQLQVAAVLDSSNRIRQRFVYGDGYAPEYVINYSYGTTITQTQYRLVKDHLGSVRMAIRVSNGTVSQRIDYDEWGRMITNTQPSLHPFGFAGGFYDSNTKLYHFGARDYDPEIGRWISKDPIVFSGGDTNLYGYVLNDPVNWIDRTGLSAEDVKKIESIFKSQIEHMNSSGLRIVPGYVNNVSRNVYFLTGGRVGRPRFNCQEQSGQMKEELDAASGNFDDTWQFSLETNGLWPFTHTTVRGISSNPSDPTLILDPWANVFTPIPK